MTRSACVCAAALVSLFLASRAVAQLSGSIALISDYRFRGVSLSEKRPAAQIAFAYDHPQGGYAGVLISSVQFPDQSRRALFLPYAGYVQTRAGFNWETGAAYYQSIGNTDYDYPEIYFGISSHRVSARIYYAHDYFAF